MEAVKAWFQSLRISASQPAVPERLRIHGRVRRGIQNLKPVSDIPLLSVIVPVYKWGTTEAVPDLTPRQIL